MSFSNPGDEMGLNGKYWKSKGAEAQTCLKGWNYHRQRIHWFLIWDDEIGFWFIDCCFYLYFVSYVYINHTFSHTCSCSILVGMHFEHRREGMDLEHGSSYGRQSCMQSISITVSIYFPGWLESTEGNTHPEKPGSVGVSELSVLEGSNKERVWYFWRICPSRFNALFGLVM